MLCTCNGQLFCILYAVFTVSRQDVNSYILDICLLLTPVMTARPRSERLGDIKPTINEPQRDTVYLDLRKTNQDLAEERQRLAVVQRVLKLNQNQ